MKKAMLALAVLAAMELHAQSFDARSPQVSLRIKDWSHDSMPPVLTVNGFTSLPGFPVYQRDSVAVVSGKVEDVESGVFSILINGKKPEIYNDGKFMTHVPLSRGRNEIVINSTDKRKNSLERRLRVVYDPNADVEAPRITILEPVAMRGFRELPADNETLHLSGMVVDDSKVMALYINRERVYFSPAGEFTKDFRVVPDSLTFSAVDSFGNEGTKKFPVVKRGAQPKDEILEAGTYHALVIGVQAYKDHDLPDLYHPLKDGAEIVNTLVNNYTFDKKNVALLSNPSRQEIMTSLESMKRKLTTNDNLLIFYAGHGYWEEDMQQGYWLPSDASREDKAQWISNSEIRDYVRGIKAKHTLLLVDACFGGAIFQQRDIANPLPDALKDVVKLVCRKAITSGALKAVPDRSDFVQYLIRALTNNSQPYFRAEDLYRYLKESVLGNNPKATLPQYGPVEGAGDDRFGDFVFVHR